MAVTYRLDGDVAVLTLDRPDRYNAISQQLCDELVAGLGRAADEARAAVITGAGKAFCSGADLSDLMGEYEAGGPDLGPVIDRRFNPIVEALVDVEVPTIAAVNGVAAGAGMGIALACDLRVMAEESFFLPAFIGLALVPDTGSTWFLPRHLGLSRAVEFTFTNRRLGAAEAAELGLAHRVVPADRVVAEAVEWAGELANGHPPAYAATRRLLHQASASDLTAALAAERFAQAELGAAPAHLEGMKAFLEKRPADFRSVT